MTTEPRGLLMVSAFVSHKAGSHPVAEDVAARLRREVDSVICVSSRQSAVMRGLDMVATVLRRRNAYDAAILFLYSGRAFLWGEAVAALLEKLRCPFVIAMHGGALPDFAALHPRRVARTLSRATIVTAPSSYLLERMRPYRGDIRLLPNPIQIDRYSYRLRDHVEPKLAWLRAFHRIYNPELAVSVAAHLRDRFPDLRLSMAGPDKGDGSWQATAQAASLDLAPNRFLMPGAVPNSDVPEWLNRADVFINTSNVDNTPVSVIEAMACGLPVVSTNVGGLPYLLTDGTDALLVPPGDPEAMAAAVVRLLTEPGLAARLSRNARHKAEGLDWSRVLPMWREVLATLR